MHVKQGDIRVRAWVNACTFHHSQDVLGTLNVPKIAVFVKLFITRLLETQDAVRTTVVTLPSTCMAGHQRVENSLRYGQIFVFHET